jgi:anaerobic ribonucleoside-triphosphate reductase
MIMEETTRWEMITMEKSVMMRTLEVKMKRMKRRRRRRRRLMMMMAAKLKMTMENKGETVSIPAMVAMKMAAVANRTWMLGMRR